jgi:hypothetical protein
MNLAMVAHSATLPVRGAEMQGAEVSTRTMTLKSADSEMQARATTRTLEVADSDAAACPTTTDTAHAITVLQRKCNSQLTVCGDVVE